MPGVWAAYTVPRISVVRVARYVSSAWYARNRSTSNPVTSTSGLPSTIHCATTRPRPPADSTPTEFMPAATKYPRVPGASPTIGDRSGVNDSGPQKNVRTPASSVTGTRDIAVSRNGPIRSQSGLSVVNDEPAGTPSGCHAAARGSKRPTIMPPPSSR